ncbi:MAG: GTPase ObgE [Peptococcaceae bacterium]|nr:GTPase ObgE [Peptococcaceae bacterium]
MFYDYSKIYVKGGDGGNGVVAFRREKYVPYGGPSGGDGGKGGDIIFIGNGGMHTLIDFKSRHHYRAERGEHGQGKTMHGRKAPDLRVKVPLGTVVRNAETKEVIADITVEGQEVIVAHGGRGGRGNARFMTAKNKAPQIAENGEPGEELWLELELKLLADVALVGMPNAGKSTIISKVSASKPKIADYPFTTIQPNLGVVDMGDGESFVIADVPGLIEGAHSGAGLGHRFLRHVERTKILLHVVDMSGFEGKDPCAAFTTINQELQLYKESIGRRPQLVVANKMDSPEAIENLEKLLKKIGDKYEVYPVSAITGEGLEPLMRRAFELVQTLPVEEEVETIDLRVVKVREEQPFIISQIADGWWEVKGEEIEKLVAMTNFDHDESMLRLQRIMTKMGLDQALRDAGVVHGDTVVIGKREFDFSD